MKDFFGGVILSVGAGALLFYAPRQDSNILIIMLLFTICGVGLEMLIEGKIEEMRNELKDEILDEIGKY